MLRLLPILLLSTLVSLAEPIDLSGKWKLDVGHFYYSSDGLCEAFPSEKYTKNEIEMEKDGPNYAVNINVPVKATVSGNNFNIVEKTRVMNRPMKLEWRGIIQEENGKLIISGTEYCNDGEDTLPFKLTYKEISESLDEEGKVLLRGVQFDSNSAELKAPSSKVLSDLAEWLEKNPKAKIELGGHTDSKGRENHNQKLSLERSASVKKWLIDNDISSERLSTKGYGEKKPVTDNSSGLGRALNRRVEVTVMRAK